MRLRYMNYMIRTKRSVYLMLVVYLVFSQFFVKARVSTDFSLYSQEDFCLTKKFDTYESKRSCRHVHNIADTHWIYDLFSFLALGEIEHILPDIYAFFAKDIRTITAQQYAHGPPWDLTETKQFLYTYIGVTLLLC